MSNRELAVQFGHGLGDPPGVEAPRGGDHRDGRQPWSSPCDRGDRTRGLCGALSRWWAKAKSFSSAACSWIWGATRVARPSTPSSRFVRTRTMRRTMRRMRTTLSGSPLHPPRRVQVPRKHLLSRAASF